MMKRNFKYKLPYQNLYPFLVLIGIALLLLGSTYLLPDFDTTSYPINNGKRGTSRTGVLKITTLITIVLLITLLVNVVKIKLFSYNQNKIQFEEDSFIIPKGKNGLRKTQYSDIKRPIERRFKAYLTLNPKKFEFNPFKIYVKGFDTEDEYFQFEKTLQEYVANLPEEKPKQIWE